MGSGFPHDLPHDLPPGWTPGWQAGLELALTRRQGATRIGHLRHWGPLRVQRPFYPAGADGECHVYVLHPPGGMVTGDQLEMAIRLGEDTHGLLTTPSAGKLYRGNTTEIRQKQLVHCQVENGAYLEWLPQETIVFDGARGELALRVELAENAHCCLWDIVCLGRPASAETFNNGFLRQRLEVMRGGVALYSESNRFIGGSPLLQQRWGLAGYPVSGSMLVTANLNGEQLNQLRQIVQDACPPEDLAALSDLGGLIAIRYLGGSAEHCKRLFIACWRLLRPMVKGVEALAPRIWNT